MIGSILSAFASGMFIYCVGLFNYDIYSQARRADIDNLLKLERHAEVEQLVKLGAFKESEVLSSKFGIEYRSKEMEVTFQSRDDLIGEVGDKEDEARCRVRRICVQ